MLFQLHLALMEVAHIEKVLFKKKSVMGINGAVNHAGLKKGVGGGRWGKSPCINFIEMKSHTKIFQRADFFKKLYS